MDNKNLIIIPSLSSFENTLGIYDRKIKGAVLSQINLSISTCILYNQH